MRFSGLFLLPILNKPVHGFTTKSSAILLFFSFLLVMESTLFYNQLFIIVFRSKLSYSKHQSAVPRTVTARIAAGSPLYDQ